MNGEFLEALQQIAKEKDIPLETLVETVESALATAYKRNFATGAEIHGEIRVRIDSSKAANTPFKIFCEKLVVDQVENDYEQISLTEAREFNPDVMAGEVVEIPIHPGNFGRIAAQTAKQVMMQRIREAERRKVFDEFNERIGEVMTGVVQRKEGRNVIVNLGKLDALLPVQEQVESEPYRFNDRIKVYVLEVRETNKGAQVVVSRTHPSLIRRLFELEVPEIADGIVSIKSVAREPGARSKIAVTSRDEKVDPVGACVGHRGSRVQAVVNELYDEKIDIVRWNADAGSFIAEALSPAKAVKATVNEETKSAFVVVPDNQLSLAIGKAGQNVRLAARLTGWRIDIRSEAQVARAALMAVTDTSDEEEIGAGLTDMESSEDEEATGAAALETVGSNGHKPTGEAPAEDENAAQEVTPLSGEADNTETAEDAESAEAGAL
jgi:transcription termination/antitermination protein NusA